MQQEQILKKSHPKLISIDNDNMKKAAYSDTTIAIFHH